MAAVRKRNSDKMANDYSSDDEETPLLPDPEPQMTTRRNTQRDEQQRDHDEQAKEITFGRSSVSANIKNRIKWVAQNVTLEPMLFLKMVAEANYSVVADTLEIERVCEVNLNYTKEECMNMDDGNHSDVQTAVQRYQNIFNYYQSIIDSVLPLLVVIFVGSMSDRYGRKPFMLAVLAGFISVAFLHIVVTLNPLWPVEVLLAATLAVDITGSWVVFNMIVYSYLSDITSPENRTKRMGLLDFIWYLGSPVGNLLGGWLYHWSGYIAVFTVSCVLWAVCFLYTLFWVKESVDKSASSPNNTETEKYARWGPLKHVVLLFETAFRRRPGNARSLIFGLLALKLFVFFTQGHQMYLWSRRVLQWGATEFSTWSSAEFLIHQVGLAGWVTLAERFSIHDTLVAVGGLVSQGLWCAVLACIPGPGLWWLVIVASFLGMIEGSIEPAIRTLLTVVVGENEAGKILAFNGLLEAIWLIVDRTVFTSLYNTFVEVFPQINLVFQAGVCLVLILFLIFLRMVFKKQPMSAPTLRTVQNLSDDEALDRPQEHPSDSNRPHVY